MVVMAVVARGQQFEPGHAVAKIKPFDDTHCLQQVHGSVNRRQIAFPFRQSRKNLLVGQWMAVAAQDFKNDSARFRELAGVSAQPVGQIRQRLPPGRLGPTVRFHDCESLWSADFRWMRFHAVAVPGRL